MMRWKRIIPKRSKDEFVLLYRIGEAVMVDEVKNETKSVPEETPDEENSYEEFGWEFHKMPLLYALILTALFYAFILFYIHIG